MENQQLADLRKIAQMMRNYIELALQEYEAGNTRQANTLYRRAKKISGCDNLPKTISAYYKHYEMIT